MTVIEVFADVGCPFAHIGLARFVERRAEEGRDDVKLHVRAWPLEVVNGTPLSPAFIGEEIDEICDEIDTDLFDGFDVNRFPPTSIPALTLTAAAYRSGFDVGEAVALEVRSLCFHGRANVADQSVLDEVAARHGVTVHDDDGALVPAELSDGRDKGVIGSPHFFTPSGDFFCPSLDVGRDTDGHLRIHTDPEGFDGFLESCFAT